MNNYPNSREGQNEPSPLYAQWANIAESVETPAQPVEIITPPAEPEPNLVQVSDRMGSNEGGWFENPNGERYYVKFYENPDQGKVEFIANSIYEKLGVKAVHSELINVDGREAISSKEIPYAFQTSSSEQKESLDVQSGFVADAYLANLDVVGLVCDNIVENDDGFHRIDNGGSLIFRARGGDKAYSPDSIPELQSMRHNSYTSGEVFGDISEADIKRQARDLVQKLTPEDIQDIVDKSGIEGEARDRVLRGLIGRREYLARTYGGESSRDRLLRNGKIRESIRKIADRELERAANGLIRSRAEIVCDHDHIEGQKIDIVSKKDEGTIEFRFKMRTGTSEYDNLASKGLGEKTASGVEVRRGLLFYDSASPDDTKESICDAVIFDKGVAKVKVADAYSRFGNRHDEPQARSAMGLVSVEVPADTDPETISDLLSGVLEDDLGVPNALGEVSEGGERMYKQARYAWQHKIKGDLTPEQQTAAEKLQRKEVFPGYTTYVEEGKNEEYLEKYGSDVRAIHTCFNTSANMIRSILTQGLMSTTERFSRGLLFEGMSSKRDIETGGADSVFTRIMYPNSWRQYKGVVVVMKPEVFDRTDWYTYDHDSYGSTSDFAFGQRLSPDEMFTEALDPSIHTGGNEQMFRTGIGPEYIEHVEVSGNDRDRLIRELKEAGLTEFNGKPIEEVILARSEEPIEDTFTEANKVLIAENMAKIEALANGELPYESPQQLFKLTVGMEHPYDQMVSMITAVIYHNGTEQLAKDMAQYLIDSLGVTGLEYLKEGDAPPDHTNFDYDMYDFIITSLNLDLDELYDEANGEYVASKKAEFQDILDGKASVPNINYVFYMADVLHDEEVAEQVIDALVEHHQDTTVKNGALSYFMIDVGLTNLDYLKKGEIPLAWDATKTKIHLNIAKALGVDLNEAYAKALEESKLSHGTIEDFDDDDYSDLEFEDDGYSYEEFDDEDEDEDYNYNYEDDYNEEEEEE